MTRQFFLDILFAVDNRLPKHEILDVAALSADERRHGRTESKPNQRDSRYRLGCSHLLDGKADIVHPATCIALFARAS